MNYKGYEIRRGVKTKFSKNGEAIEVEAYGIYANGDYKGAVRTLDQARDYIDTMAKGTLYRPRERTHVIQVTNYDERGRAISKLHRADGIKGVADGI